MVNKKPREIKIEKMAQDEIDAPSDYNPLFASGIWSEEQLNNIQIGDDVFFHTTIGEIDGKIPLPNGMQMPIFSKETEDDFGLGFIDGKDAIYLKTTAGDSIQIHFGGDVEIRYHITNDMLDAYNVTLDELKAFISKLWDKHESIYLYSPNNETRLLKTKIEETQKKLLKLTEKLPNASHLCNCKSPEHDHFSYGQYNRYDTNSGTFTTVCIRCGGTVRYSVFNKVTIQREE